jgi:hypothetical protein
MSEESAEGPSAPILCRGFAIEYKAYARSFTADQDLAVLYLVATCWFERGNLSVFFEEVPGGFRLMVESLAGHFPHLYTYYIATWPTKGAPGLSKLPPRVTIQDAFGTHIVDVMPWN